MSDFDSGYISSVNYASKLLNLMNNLTFSIILVGFMDTVSKSNEIDKYKKSISDSLTRIIFSTIPITFFCCFYNQEIISILFERGSFDSNSAELTSTAFYIFSLSLFPGVFYGYFSRVIGNMKGSKYLNFLILLQFFIYLSVMIVFLDDFEGYIMPYGYFICTTILSILIAVFYARDIIPKSFYMNFFVCVLLSSFLIIADTFFASLSFTPFVKMISSCFVLLITNGTFILLNKSVKDAFVN
jgi:putative peptidoglycan lipid II flippase